MLVAVVADPGAAAGPPPGRLRRLADDRRPLAPAEPVAALAAAVAAIEAAEAPRWLWAATAEIYPGLPRVERCHDLELTEALLLGYDGRWGEPRSLAAAWARLTGAP